MSFTMMMVFRFIAARFNGAGWLLKRALLMPELFPLPDKVWVRMVTGLEDPPKPVMNIVLLLGIAPKRSSNHRPASRLLPLPTPSVWKGTAPRGVWSPILYVFPALVTIGPAA